MEFRVIWVILIRKIKLIRKIHLSFVRVCKYLKQRVRRIVEQNGKSFKCFVKKSTHGEIGFHKSIYDRVFTTGYWLQKSA